MESENIKIGTSGTIDGVEQSNEGQVDVQTEETIANVEGNTKTSDDDKKVRKRKKKASKVWLEFTEVNLKNGEKKLACNHCGFKLAVQPSGSTTHLNRHMNSSTAHLAKVFGKSQQVLSFSVDETDAKMNSLSSFKFEKEKVRKMFAKMVIVHEYPFRMVEHQFFRMLLKSLNPLFEPLSRVTVKSDCMKLYNTEKKKLKAYLTNINKISLTSDLWTSNQTIGYMTLTTHFLDSEWNLHKKVLNFCHMPPPHSGLMISDTIFACLNDWGIENKITTITLDNASFNDTAIRHLKDAFTLKGNLYFGGKKFHVRCCAHVLNLMVQDGLSVISRFISNVRDNVKYLKSSSGRLYKFYDVAKNLQLNTSKKLMLDVPTRWNSRYAMLEAAIAYKYVFPRYRERDPYYQCLPS